MDECQVEAIRVFDKQDLMERVDGDMELAGELVELFLEDVEVKSGAIRSAIDRKDGAGIEKEAHALKGAAANLSVHAVRDLAHQLEAIGRKGECQKAGPIYEELLQAIAKASEVLKKEITEAVD